MQALIKNFIQSERLPESFVAVAENYYLPLVEQVVAWHLGSRTSLGLALNGGQGTGKSTLARFMCVYLSEQYGLRTVVLSLDDLYKTKAERLELGTSVHPLLATRGVPGTHDLKIGMECARVCLGYEKKSTTIPRFEKETDDRAPRDQWNTVDSAFDVVILEGWCVSAVAESDPAMVIPINDLERVEDSKSIWRSYVNMMLREQYQAFFELFTKTVLLRAPSFESIVGWRKKQEHKLRKQLVTSGGLTEFSGLMSDAAIDRFVMHYERLTRWMLSEMPSRADACLYLNEKHGIDRLVVKKYD